MEKYWNKEVKNIRDFFNLIDARISEHKHFGGSEEMLNLQRQECIILANNFIGDDDMHGKVYLSRMIVPFTQILKSKVTQHIT